MNICGILIHIQPEKRDEVTSRLLAICGVEIHSVTAQGQVIATLEEDNEERTASSLLAIQDLQGVISASMIYHHSETEEASPS
ncbi:MAG: chaperone NapD [Gammaproteobacteria bacterium]|nr:chaperone NapD [Gammaproteobacteria bacterium]